MTVVLETINLSKRFTGIVATTTFRCEFRRELGTP